MTAVELDKEMVTVATKYFGLPSSNPRLSIKIMDALDYLSQTATGPKSWFDREYLRDTISGVKLDAIFVDVAGAMDSNGLSCPPAPFLDTSALENMKKSLRNNGMPGKAEDGNSSGIVAVNLVTRNKELAKKCRADMAEIFPKLYRLEAEEDINEVIGRGRTVN